MNATKIEWCDFSWNPVTGCLHNCEYCYARKQIKRFAGKICTPQDGNIYNGCRPYGKVYDFIELGITKERVCRNYTIGLEPGRCAKRDDPFNPKFHPNRLDQPARRKKPARIFVVSMGDLFGEWVPDEWIERVFEACEAAPQHTYYFLTKNPKRYKLSHGYPITFFASGRPYWFGFSATGQKDFFVNLAESPKGNFGNRFISFEPLVSAIKIPSKTEAYKAKKINWLIVGAETGNRKGKIIPKREWLLDIRKQCRDLKIPLFEKNSLKPLLPEGLIQQWPEEEA